MTNIFRLGHRAVRVFCAIAAVSSSISCGAAAPTLTAIPGPPVNTAGFVAAVQKINGAQVLVSYRVTPATGASLPATVSLTFSAVTDAVASVRFTVDTGLRLLASQSPVPLPLGSSVLDIQAIPEADGLFYLNVFTTQNGATSAMSIPIAVGVAAPKLEAVGLTKPAADGQKIIALPVR